MKHLQQITPIVYVIIAILMYCSDIFGGTPPDSLKKFECLMSSEYIYKKHLGYVGWTYENVKQDTITLCETKDSLYITTPHLHGWLVGKREDNKVIFKNGQPLEAIDSIGNSCMQYLNVGLFDIFPSITFGGYINDYWTITPLDKDLIFDYNSSSKCLYNSNANFWFGQNPNEDVYLTDKIIPSSYIQDFVLYRRFYFSMTSAMMIQSDFKPLPPYVEFREGLYHDVCDHDRPYPHIYPRFLGYPYNANREIFETEKLMNAVVYYRLNDNWEDMPDPENYIMNHMTLPFQYFASPEEYTWESSYSNIDLHYEGMSLLYGPSAKIKAICYTRYYPNGISDSNNYIESDPTEPYYFERKTQVDNIYKDTGLENKTIYNLMGQPIESSSVLPGIYIRNGKKILVH